MSSTPVPSCHAMPPKVVSAMNANKNGSMSQGVSASARAITTEKASTSPSAMRIAIALRADIIGPAPTSSQTMYVPSSLFDVAAYDQACADSCDESEAQGGPESSRAGRQLPCQ